MQYIIIINACYLFGRGILSFKHMYDMPHFRPLLCIRVSAAQGNKKGSL